MFRQLFLLLIATSANATSVSPELYECPVCGTKSVTMSLDSYSQFGEPERDLSDSPQFRFADVEICPGDLYASWSDRWEKIDPEEKTKLAAFLKKPELRLTDAETAAITGHEKAFRESSWFDPLWARTCDELRNMDERRKFQNKLRFHFAGKYVANDRAPDDWEKQLVALYRKNAISALKDAAAAKWPKPKEKRVFAYLRAELTRQAGQEADALTLFQDVITAEKTTKPGDELAWISRWATEQALRCGPEANDPAKLLATIIPEMPDPWRNQKAAEDPRWPRHYAAIDVLARRAAAGEKAFSDTLWNLLDRKPERLLALLETSDSNLYPLRSADARWREWFEEIATWIEAGKLPSSLAGDPNKTRVINVLRGAVGGGDDDDEAWRKNVLLPAVRKAAAGSGIPSLKMPKEDSFPELPPIDGQTTDAPQPSPPRFKNLEQELYQLWEEQPSSVRMDIAAVYVRVLRQAEENAESTQYPAPYFLSGIAETEEGRAVIRKELDGTWRSSFWKAACAFAARIPASTEAFLHHPFTAKADDKLIFKLLGQRSDASWKDNAIKQLNEDGWTSSEVIDYLASLNLLETESALDAAAKRLRNRKSDPEKYGMPDGKLSTLRRIDEARVKARLSALPFR